MCAGASYVSRGQQPQIGDNDGCVCALSAKYFGIYLPHQHGALETFLIAIPQAGFFRGKRPGEMVFTPLGINSSYCFYLFIRVHHMLFSAEVCVRQVLPEASASCLTVFF